MNPEQAEETTRALIQEGLREAGAMGHPVVRARHRLAWAYRLAALDPNAAEALLPEFGKDPGAQAELLLGTIRERLRAGQEEIGERFRQVLELARRTSPDHHMRLLNGLSELAIQVGDRDAGAAKELLRSLVPEARALTVPETELQQPRAVACALIGEALAGLGDPLGRELLREAEELAEPLPARDHLSIFLADAIAAFDPRHAAELVAALQDPTTRLEARLSLAGKTDDPELRREILDASEEDAAYVEHWRGSEALVRVGQALVPIDPERARTFFDRAMAGAEAADPQLRGLQWTGVAYALAELDRDEAERIFREAVAAALEDGEPVRRVGALVMMADQMAAAFPRESTEVLARAMEEAGSLEELWEHAHIMDVLFRPDRSPYLDIAPARPMLERILDLLSDEDPQIPGVLGLPDVGKAMAQIDRERAVDVYRRWARNADAAGDTGGMTEAALSILRVDPEAGREELVRLRDRLLERLDCISMGEFSRAVAPVAADLALEVAPQIADPRERADATAAAAVSLYETDPDAALSALHSLERPADRSMALLMLVDRLLGGEERPVPQPLLEEMP